MPLKLRFMLQEKTSLLAPSVDGFTKFLSSLDSDKLVKPGGRIGLLVKSREKEDAILEIVKRCQEKTFQDQPCSPLFHVSI